MSEIRKEGLGDLQLSERQSRWAATKSQKQVIQMGQLFMTAAVSRAIANSSMFSRFVTGSIGRHKYQDWGDGPTPDVNRDECLGDIQGREPLSGREGNKSWDHQINDYNVIHGGRLISSYNIPKHLNISDGMRLQVKIWMSDCFALAMNVWETFKGMNSELAG